MELNDKLINIIKSWHEGHTIAFAATAIGLGIVRQGESGYYPIDPAWYSNESMEANYYYAQKLNEEELGLDKKDALEMVAHSMLGGTQ